MFEGRKIKKLIAQLSVAGEGKEESQIIVQLAQYGKTAFPYAIDALRSRKMTGTRAKEVLAKTYDKSFLGDLLKMTGDSYDVARNVSKELIVAKGREDAVPSLLANLQSPDGYLKASAVDALSAIKSHASVLKLVSLFNSANGDLKKSIISILSEIGGTVSCRLLISALKDKDWAIRIRAVRGLGKIKDPSIIEPLIEILSEKDPQLKKSALDTLGAIGDKRACIPMVQLLTDEDLMIRQKAVDYLTAIGDPGIIPDILTLMRSSDVNVRRCAVEIINNMKDPRAEEELVQAMKDSDWWVREIATDALAEIKSGNILSALKNMLKDNDENVRRCAVEFFNKVSDPSALPALLELLKDGDWWVREKTVTALGKLKSHDAIPELAELIHDEEIKWVIPDALGRIGGEEAARLLTTLLKDRQKRVRIETLKAFTHIKDLAPVELIDGLLGDPDNEVRNQAVATLKALTGKTYRTLSGESDPHHSISSFIAPDSLPEGSLLTEAIVVVDLCDSTGLADRYGDQFALDLTKILTEKARPLAEKEGFQYIKSTGDGFLITFPKTFNAVRFSFTLLAQIGEYNKGVDEAGQIDLRFAINIGETRVDAKGDRLGVATNMTFRVEGVKGEDLIVTEGGIRKEEMPRTNRILVTENVVADITQIKGVTSRFLGLFELKGISGLHRVFQLVKSQP